MPIKCIVLRTLLFIISAFISCQSIQNETSLPAHILVQVEDSVKDSFDIMSPSLKFPTEKAGYTLICPRENIQGLIVTFHAGRDTSHPGFEQRLAFDALRQSVATMYVTTGHVFDFLFDTIRLELLNQYITEVVAKYEIQKDKILYTGMSLAGTRAAKMALWQIQTRQPVQPSALALCDPPLDFIRFWKAQQHTLINQTHPISIGEATWTNYLLEQNLGGTPSEAPGRYIAYSPYVKMDSIDPKLRFFADMPLRIYTEPDLDWWMDNRARDAYGINSIDASAMIGDLRILGNETAEHITSTNKGYRPDGTRHPHSWSIVDNAELVEWMLGL